MGRPIYKPSFDPDSPQAKANGKVKLPKSKQPQPKPRKAPK